ncbi:MAG: DUF3368 domain-containing protein [Candidatus Hydrothermarchaeota archaeon]
MIVSNSTPLIYLAKIGKLNLLKEFFEIILIPEEVKTEVVDKGKKLGSPDAFLLEKCMEEGWIKVERVENPKDLEEFGIDKGEAEAISLALERNLDILADQTHARLAAKVLGLMPRGTIYVLLRALKEGILDYDEYLKCLRDLVMSNFRMSDEVYLEAVRIGKEIMKK